MKIKLLKIKNLHKYYLKLMNDILSTKIKFFE